MSRWGMMAFSLILMGFFLCVGTGDVRAQGIGVVKFNNAGVLNAEDATWRIILGKRDGSVNWPTGNALATNYDFSTDPFFAGLKPFTPVWKGLVNIESAAKNTAVLNAVGRANTWLFGAVAPSSTADNPPDGTAAYWIRTRDGATIWNGRSPDAGNAVSDVYANWKSGEPNNSGNNEWAANFLGGENGLWNDHTGVNTPGGYILEVDLGANLLEIDPAANQMILNPLTGMYYLRGATARTWADAKTYAEMRTFQGAQGQLTTVPNKATNVLLASVGGGWMGLTDNPIFGGTETGTPDQQPDVDIRRTSGWVWSGPNGATPLKAGDYMAWNTGEPNGGTSEDYADVQTNRTWNDCGPGTTRVPIVEFPGQTPIGRNFYIEQFAGDTFRNIVTTDPTATGHYAAISFADPENAGGTMMANGYIPYPGDTDGNDDNFMIRARTDIYIPEAGTYVFGSSHDDAAQVFIYGKNMKGTILNWTGSASNVGEVTFDAPGYYHLTMLQQENTGGAGVNLIAMKKGDADTSDFGKLVAAGAQLIGDTLHGGMGTQAWAPTLQLTASPKGFTVRQVSKPGGGTLNSYGQIDTILADGASMLPGGAYSITGVELINYGDGGNGNFINDNPFPGGAGHSFVLQATTDLQVFESGWYTFGSASDDSFMLIINGAAFDTAWGSAYVDNGILYANQMNNVNTGGATVYLDAGESYFLDFRFWENGGGEYTELWWAAGQWDNYYPGMYQLLETGPWVPEPATWVMLLMGVTGLFCAARKNSRRKNA